MTHNIIIRPAHDDDHKGIVTVQVEGWKTAYRGMINDDYLDSISIEDRLLSRLSYIYEHHRFSFVAEVNGKIVGMIDCGISTISNYDKGEIYALYVDSHYQKQGVGRNLVKKACTTLLEQNLTPLYVITLKANTPARHFYERFGFTYLCEHTSTIGGISYDEVVYILKYGNE